VVSRLDKQSKSIHLQDVWNAQNRIQSIVSQTPFVPSPVLGERIGKTIHLKLENMHPTGSFKIRGAANKMMNLTDDEKSRGVTTFSTGNHGVAVAYVAKKLDIKATICISKRVPQVKVERIKRFGAEIVQIGNSQDEAADHAYELEKEHGMTVIKPFDDPHIIAGQGTIALEMLKKVPKIDTAIIQISGGGLFSGIAYVLKQINPHIKIIGVTMENSAVMYESIQVGKPIEIDEQATLADSLLGGIGLDNQYTFSMTKNLIDEFVLVSEEEIKEGIVYMADQHRFIVEGAAATGLAALMSGKGQVVGSNIATIITGNTIDTLVFNQILQNYFN